MRISTAGLLLLLACNGSRTPVYIPAAPETQADAQIVRIERGLLPPVRVRGEDHRRALVDQMRAYKIPGLAIAVFENYELKWTRAYGYADTELGQRATTETTFLAGSISKSVNALAALMVVADGTLALDAPINQSLTSWKLPDNELTRARPVTLRMLLGHTAGLTVHGFPGYAAGATIPTITQILDGEKPANTGPIRVDLAPGSKFRYSGGGTTISQLALVERTGIAYPSLLAERVLRPLGMTHSSFEQTLDADRLARAAAGYRMDGSIVPGKRHAYPEMAAAGLWTTPADLARFYAEVARARAGKSAKIPQAIAKQMTTKVADVNPTVAVGLGVFLSQRNGVAMFGHDGADEGFQAFALASLDGGYGVVIMTNSDNGHLIFDEIARGVFVAQGWPTAEPEIERVALDAVQRGRVVGRYGGRGNPFAIASPGSAGVRSTPKKSAESITSPGSAGVRSTPGGSAESIAERDGRLVFQSPFRRAVDLVPTSPTTFVAFDTGTRLRLEPDGSLVFEGANRPPQTAPRLGDIKLPLLELEAGRFDDAVALWKQLAKANPKDPAVDEEALNLLGYEVMRDDPAGALGLFRLIVAANPESSNAHDSVAEAYMLTGDKAQAIAHYELAIAKLAADSRIPADQKPGRREHAETLLAKLRAP